MPYNISLRTKIIINGKEYNSIEEMEPEVRQQYERVIARRNTAKPGNPLQRETRILVNGIEYDSADKMPADIRKIYERMNSSFDDNHNGIPDIFENDPLESPSRMQSQRSLKDGRNVKKQLPNSSNTAMIIVLSVIIVILIVLLLLK